MEIPLPLPTPRMRVTFRGARLPRVVQKFHPKAIAELWSGWTPATVLLPQTRTFIE